MRPPCSRAYSASRNANQQPSGKSPTADISVTRTRRTSPSAKRAAGSLSVKLDPPMSDTLPSSDNHFWPAWAPLWLRAQVVSPDCSNGTHPRLRWLAKWLTIYFAEHSGEAHHWLCYAAQSCDRNVPQDEIDRLLSWAQ